MSVIKFSPEPIPTKASAFAVILKRPFLHGELQPKNIIWYIDAKNVDPNRKVRLKLTASH